MHLFDQLAMDSAMLIDGPDFTLVSIECMSRSTKCNVVIDLDVKIGG
jgi:hypothetical protein